MFSLYHFIWIFISLATVVAGIYILKKYTVSLDRFLTVACVGSVLSEVVKTFSVIKMLPLDDGQGYTPYIEMSEVPLHLCSFQIILIFYVKFSKNEKWKHLFLSFMYPTCTAGAFLAILLPSIFSDNVLPQEAFIKPHAYQYFLYHAMLIILGIYIYISGKEKIKPKNFFTTVIILLAFAFLSFYLNSIFATPIYENGELLSVQHMPNFFFTFQTPIDIPLTRLSHWYIYLSIIVLLGLLLIGLFYLPVFLRAKKEKSENQTEEKEKMRL